MPLRRHLCPLGRQLAAASDTAINNSIINSTPNADVEEHTDVSRGDVGRFAGEMECSRKYVSFKEFIMCGPTAQIAADVLGTSQLAVLLLRFPVRETEHQRTDSVASRRCALAGEERRRGECLDPSRIPLDPVPKQSCLELVIGSLSHRADSCCPHARGLRHI